MPTPPSWPRRLRVPLVVVAVPAVLRAFLFLMGQFDFGLGYQFVTVMLFKGTCVLAVLVLLVWYFFGNRLPRRVWWCAAGVGLSLILAALVAIRTVEFDGQMSPHVRFRWQPSAADQLATFRTATPPADSTADLTVGPDDSPAYRGPAGDGTAPAKLADDWTATPPQVVWRHPVGGGHAGVAVAGNSLVTLEQWDGNEAVVCYDRDTGRQRWAYPYPARFTTTEAMGGDGPRTTPSVAGGLVYALGGAGDLVCLDGKTGAKKWAANILADAGAVNLDWGLSGSPLVTDGNVVVNPGVDPKANQGKAIAAYDCTTGAKLWATGSQQAGYASPQRADFRGMATAVVFDATGVGGYALADGKELWRHPWPTAMGANSAQPVVVGPDRLFVPSDQSQGGAVIDLAGVPKLVWQGRGLSARYCSPVLHNGHLYGLAGSKLVCVDAATGKKQWDEGNYGNGQLLLADGKLVVTAEKGFVALVKADPAEFAELGSFTVFADRTWNVPALAGSDCTCRNLRHHARARQAGDVQHPLQRHREHGVWPQGQGDHPNRGPEGPARRRAARHRAGRDPVGRARHQCPHDAV